MNRSKTRVVRPAKRALTSYTFRVVIEEDLFDVGRMAYHAYLPALRQHGASTWGYTAEEALKNIQEVAKLVVESLSDHGESIPTEPATDVRISFEPLVTVTSLHDRD